MSSWKGPKRSTKHYIYNIRSLKAQGPEGSLQYVKPIKWLYSIFSHILFLLPPSDYALLWVCCICWPPERRYQKQNYRSGYFCFLSSHLHECPAGGPNLGNDDSQSQHICTVLFMGTCYQQGGRWLEIASPYCKVTVYYEINFPIAKRG